MDKKKISAKEAIAAAIGSILHPNKQEMEEENQQNRERKRKDLPAVPYGEALSEGVRSPRLTDVAKVIEASTSPVDEYVLRQVTEMSQATKGVRAYCTDVQSSREFIDEKGVRLHNVNLDYRNAARGGVTTGHLRGARVPPGARAQPPRPWSR